ncbi:Protein of unknown function (DUF674 [Striga hermonthica]|uniref:DUF674 domain-containing protein n=1 Tax=Striga hermonthica TaxID=68872 RepID=A0A9N7P2G0_STRHE|nr:Protein of unknown function (DUF674 [Striga hermonthica]
MANSSVSLKLLIDSRAKRVLFAEAGKDTVDFLFYILSLPVANLISLVGKEEMVGSLANLYESVHTLNETYIQPNQTKNTLLKPAYPVPGSTAVPLLALKDSSSGADQKKFYGCCCTRNNRFYDDDDDDDDYGVGGYMNYVSDGPNATCPSCNNFMSREVTYVAPPVVKRVPSGPEGGFVKGVVTYMVMDDLVVTPMSTISSITLLNKFNVKEVGALEAGAEAR